MKARTVWTWVLRAIVTIVFLFVMINVVLPWAAASMVDGFVRQIESTQEP